MEREEQRAKEEKWMKLSELARAHPSVCPHIPPPSLPPMRQGCLQYETWLREHGEEALRSPYDVAMPNLLGGGEEEGDPELLTHEALQAGATSVGDAAAASAAAAARRSDRPVVRQKSDLPHDPSVDAALSDHMRHDPFLKAIPPDPPGAASPPVPPPHAYKASLGSGLTCRETEEGPLPSLPTSAGSGQGGMRGGSNLALHFEDSTIFPSVLLPFVNFVPIYLALQLFAQRDSRKAGSTQTKCCPFPLSPATLWQEVA